MPVLKLLRSIFEGEIKAGTIDRPTARIVARYLQRSVLGGYGKRLTQLTFGTAEHELVAQLHYNAAVFSAFKNHKQQIDIAAALTDAQGRPRSWPQFRTEALKISTDYNVRYLQAEFTTARLQAAGANKWHSFRQAAELYPSLRYSAVQDARTRPQHKAWHAIVRPINDPFWDTHFPPNGWRCRCTAYQTDQKATGLPPPQLLEQPDKPFRNNPGKTGLLWSRDHPYYRKPPRALPQAAKNFAISVLRNQMRDWAFKNLTNKTFTKEGLQSTFTRSSIKKVLDQPHEQKYFQMLTLLDFEKVFKKAKPFRLNVPDEDGRFNIKAWHYFEVDIYGKPSLINIREETDGRINIYSISEKGE